MSSREDRQTPVDGMGIERVYPLSQVHAEGCLGISARHADQPLGEARGDAAFAGRIAQDVGISRGGDAARLIKRQPQHR
jgi:hypothetical protein